MMRKNTLTIALAPLVFACSSASAPVDPTVLSAPVAQNITINEIAILQALKVPVMQGGNVADRNGMPLVALRDSVLRIYVTPGNDWTPHQLTARARIATTSPTGSTAQVFSTTTMVGGTTIESDLTTSIQVPIPGIALEPGASITVVLNDTTGDPPDVPTSSARWPADGSSSDLAVSDGGNRVRVMIVPVQYQADGSNRLPDTSDAMMESYRERFYQLYPTAEVDMTVRAPWPYNGVISGNGSGFSSFLMAFGQLRSADMPDPDVYYYAAVEPGSSFNSYCGGGCITGLSPIGGPYSVGIGYTGPQTTETAVHEVGHAHGRYHAPCGGAADPDPMYPYAGALIGVWGYDSINNVMVDPTMTTDMMSYCSPTWISDYHYDLIFSRVRTDNGYYMDWAGGQRSKAYSLAEVPATGNVKVSSVRTQEPWITQGIPREATWEGGSATAYYFPYDHLPGGIMYVPDEVPNRARLADVAIER